MRASLEPVTNTGPPKSPASKINISKRLKKLGINTGRDLLYYFPSRHQVREVKFASELQDGESAVIIGHVGNFVKTNPRPGLHILRARVTSIEGTVFTATWFNEQLELTSGTQIAIFGRVKIDGYGTQVNVSDWAELEDGRIPENFTGLRPVYALKKGITNNFVCLQVQKALSAVKLEEFLPDNVLMENGLMGIHEAIRQVHFPQSQNSLENARQRLAFDEMFLLQLALRLKRESVSKPKANRYKASSYLPSQFINDLPFKLTRDQAKAWSDISRDMASPFPMKRLLLGDVGCGKTVVSALALLKAAECGLQGVMMVPTEILARQHYETLAEWFKDYGLTIGLAISGNQSNVDDADIIVGTHSLIHNGVEFQRVGVVVIDEQHRFGVEQRLTLQEKANRPDVLVMTATPIPRTLALTSYGDMDISVIKELPKGRIPIKTYVTKDEDKVIKFIYKELTQGRQAYFVCPLVEESEAMDLENATNLHLKLVQQLKPYKVRIVHGRLKAAEKEEIMTAFKKGQINVLVSTTVIEVGVNVPNATVMVIYEADRFGLAQLHQLRGRVGRGGYESYCICVVPNITRDKQKAIDRLRAFASTTDGFKLAEFDLKQRGAGEFFGTKQAGLVDIKIADLNDIEMLNKARSAAFKVKLSPELVNEVKQRYFHDTQ